MRCPTLAFPGSPLAAFAALALLLAGLPAGAQTARDEAGMAHGEHRGAEAHHTSAITGVAVPAPLGESKVGVLVMAHGGRDEWNASVEEALAPLRREVPTALALGMAARATLEAGIDSLRAAGVERVAVVRMFLSGTSFRTQTDYLLGLSDEVPSYYMHHDAQGKMIHGEHAHGLDVPPPIDTEGLTVLTHDDGLKAWRGIGRILEARVLALSSDPTRERILVLAHGMGSEQANRAVLDDMSRALDGLQEARGFSAVVPETLREDWPEARAAAEARIRGFMYEARAAGETVLVIPFRLSGFGPYAKVLEGWDYRAGEALLPHPAVSDWALEKAGGIACAEGWSHPALSCPLAAITQEADRGN
jgi:sirohydrochlorin ferrochelatase